MRAGNRVHGNIITIVHTGIEIRVRQPQRGILLYFLKVG